MKPTAGNFTATGNGVHVGTCCVATTHIEPREQRHADAVLISDAFNTYHATGLTPSELAAQRDELRIAAIEALDAMKNIWRTEGRDDDWIYDEMGSELSAGYFSLRAAITNATKGEK